MLLEALLGIRELFETHPNLLPLHAATALEKTVSLLCSDDDENVRFTAAEVTTTLLNTTNEVCIQLLILIENFRYTYYLYIKYNFA